MFSPLKSWRLETILRLFVFQCGANERFTVELVTVRIHPCSRARTITLVKPLVSAWQRCVLCLSVRFLALSVRGGSGVSVIAMIVLGIHSISKRFIRSSFLNPPFSRWRATTWKRLGTGECLKIPVSETCSLHCFVALTCTLHASLEPVA